MNIYICDIFCLGSLLSDLSYTRSEDFDYEPQTEKPRSRKLLRSTSPDINEFQINKKRKSAWSQNQVNIHFNLYK